MGYVKETVYTNKNKFGNPLSYEERKAIFAHDDQLDAVVENTSDWYIKSFLEIGARANTYTIRLNPDSRRGFDICMLTYDCKLEGLNIPKGTRFLKTINTVDPEWQLVKRMVLREFLDDYSDDPKKAEKIADLFSPAFGFKKQDPMQTAIMTLAKDYVQSKLNGGSTFSLQNHKFKPEHFANNEPIESFIPPLEWFPESLKQVKFEDIFSIVSTKPELEVLKLFFGRVAIGASKYETHGETITSDFRTIALVQSSAGCGKSKFVDYLSSAMTKIGLSVEAMQDPAARFNQAPALLANLSVSDDSGEKKMIAFSQSPLIKSCATGSPIRVEEKGVDARTIVPNAAILAFLNDIPLKILRSSDTGNADRLALIKADSQNRLRDTRNVSELLKGVESRIIPATTNWICNKLNISTDLLYAYMLRLCLDYFSEFYDENNKAYLVNNHIRKQKQYFKLAINSEYRQAYFNFILLADKLLHPNEPITDFNVAALIRAVRSGCVIALSDDDWAKEIRDDLEKDYYECFYGATHWFAGLRDTGKGFFAEMAHRLDDFCNRVYKTANPRRQVRVPDAGEAINMLFKGTTLRNGTMFEHTASELILFFDLALEDLEIEDERIAKYRTIIEGGVKEESKKFREGKINLGQYLFSYIKESIDSAKESASAQFHAFASSTQYNCNIPNDLSFLNGTT